MSKTDDTVIAVSQNHRFMAPHRTTTGARRRGRDEQTE
jgi:hypothetical protein